MAFGPLEFSLLQEILAAFFLASDLPDTAQYSCRCSDRRYDTLRKILNVVATDAELPNAAQFFPRPGDSEAILARKLLVALGGECRCSPDSLFNLWRKILEQVRINSGNPDTAFFAFRFLDDRNAILQKILNNLNNAIAPPVPPVDFCCPPPIGIYGSILDPVTLTCQYGSILDAPDCFATWGNIP